MHSTFEGENKSQQSSTRDEVLAYTDHVLLWTVIFGAVTWFINSITQGIFALYARTVFSAPEWQIGCVLFLSLFFTALMMPVWVRLGDQYGFGRVIVYTFIPTLIFTFMEAIAVSFPLLAAVYILCAACNTTDEVIATFIVALVPRNSAEEWINANAGYANLMSMTGVIASCALFEFVTPNSSFYFASACAGAAFILSWRVLSGQQEIAEENIMTAYKVDAIAQGHENPDDEYIPGNITEREEFPIVLNRFNARADRFDVWSLSLFELYMLVLETIMSSIFSGTVMMLFAWWPLYCKQRWNAGPTLATTQLIGALTISVVGALIAAPMMQCFAMTCFDPTYTSVSEELQEGDVVSQNARDRATTASLIIINGTLATLWRIGLFEFSFSMNWILILLIGTMYGIGTACCLLLTLRFERVGNSPQVFSLQGVCWQWSAGLFHLVLGVLWSYKGYLAVVYMNMACYGAMIVLCGILYIFLLKEDEWNK